MVASIELARSFLTKLARVFGDRPDDTYMHDAAIPERDRLRHLQQHLKRKAGEGKTPWSTALLTGGGIGAAAGGLTGLAAAGSGATSWKGQALRGLVGAAAGGALGAGVGALTKKNDDYAMEEARYQSRQPRQKQRRYLHERTVAHRNNEQAAQDWQHTTDRWEAEERHEELMRELRNRSKS